MIKLIEEKLTEEHEVIMCQLCDFKVVGSFEKHEKSYRHQRKLVKARRKLARFVRANRKRIQKQKGFYGRFKGLKKMLHFRKVFDFDL